MAWDENLEPGTPAYKLASDESPVIRAVAGPGSGKSFAIKRRVSRLLEQGVPPERILAITFTRTAAQDLNNEISSLGIVGAEAVHSRTIHSHALKILMQNEVLQITERYPRIVIDHEIDPALCDLDDPEFGDKKAKRKLLSSYLASWATLQSDNPGFERDEIEERFTNKLTEWLVNHNGMLIGEVIYLVISFLRNNPASEEVGKYHTILVDEYQDLNRSEQEFIKLIRGSADMVIVGDDDQSIYSFKYAHPEGIKEIDMLFGKYSDVSFSECRRCPQQVTKMASELISHNTNRTLGDLIPSNSNALGDVKIIQWRDLDSEIKGIAQIIRLVATL